MKLDEALAQGQSAIQSAGDWSVKVGGISNGCLALAKSGQSVEIIPFATVSKVENIIGAKLDGNKWEPSNETLI